MKDRVIAVTMAVYAVGMCFILTYLTEAFR